MNLEIYNPSISSDFLSYAEAKKEYTKQRKIALKRIKRLKESGLETTIYEKYEPLLKPIKDFSTEQQLRKALYSAARYNTLKTGTVSGLKAAQKQYAETMRNRGYNVANKDVAALGRFIGKVKNYYKNEKQFDSERVINYFLEHKGKSASAEEVESVFRIWESGEKSKERRQKIKEDHASRRRQGRRERRQRRERRSRR